MMDECDTDRGELVQDFRNVGRHDILLVMNEGIERENQIEISILRCRE